jgi:hypothetical protein
MQKSYKLDKKTAKKLLPAAILAADKVMVDQLDCEVSWCRQRSDKTPEQVLEIVAKGERKVMYSFIWREIGEYWDVGCSIYGGREPDLFLWINLSPEVGETFIEKYKLQQLI